MFFVCVLFCFIADFPLNGNWQDVIINSVLNDINKTKLMYCYIFFILLSSKVKETVMVNI